MQPLVLEPVRESARFLTFKRVGDVRHALTALAAGPWDVDNIIGFGAPVTPAVEPFPAHFGQFPSTQSALWLSTQQKEKGAQLDAAMKIARTLRGVFEIVEEVDAFTYLGGRDLSGFVDGTENPMGDKATEAAVIHGRGPGLDGGSYVAVQRFVHDLEALDRMSALARDHVFGRRFEDDEEIADAPLSSHVKRTAQESFDPPAFMVRRSMPYGGVKEHGLYFVAYVETVDRFARVLRRMAGTDDGIVDGMLSFTRAVTGGYYFVPPLVDGRLDLRALGM